MDHAIAHQPSAITPDFSAHEARVSYSKAREAHALRELNWLIDVDGCRVLKGRFTPEQGAVIRQALEKAMDALFDERADEHPDVSAETRGGCCR